MVSKDIDGFLKVDFPIVCFHSLEVTRTSSVIAQYTVNFSQSKQEACVPQVMNSISELGYCLIECL